MMRFFLVVVEKLLEGVGALGDFSKWDGGFWRSADMDERMSGTAEARSKRRRRRNQCGSPEDGRFSSNFGSGHGNGVFHGQMRGLG